MTKQRINPLILKERARKRIDYVMTLEETESLARKLSDIPINEWELRNIPNKDSYRYYSGFWTPLKDKTIEVAKDYFTPIYTITLFGKDSIVCSPPNKIEEVRCEGVGYININLSTHGPECRLYNLLSDLRDREKREALARKARRARNSLMDLIGTEKKLK